MKSVSTFVIAGLVAAGTAYSQVPEPPIEPGPPPIVTPEIDKNAHPVDRDGDGIADQRIIRDAEDITSEPFRKYEGGVIYCDSIEVRRMTLNALHKELKEVNRKIITLEAKAPYILDDNRLAFQRAMYNLHLRRNEVEAKLLSLKLADAEEWSESLARLNHSRIGLRAALEDAGGAYQPAPIPSTPVVVRVHKLDPNGEIIADDVATGVIVRPADEYVAMGARIEYVKIVDQQVEAIDRKIAALKAAKTDVQPDNRMAYTNALFTLQAQHRNAKRQLAKLILAVPDSSADWELHKHRVERAMTKVRAAHENANGAAEPSSTPPKS